MAGEIQLNSTTLATESSGAITLSNVNSATNRTNLGLGSMATQNANAVAITGGTINTVQPATGQSLTIKDEDGNTAITIGTSNTATGYLSLNFGSYNGGSGTLTGNTLSDYEEGSWSPNVVNSGSSSTFTSKTGRYTKIGRIVYATFVCDSGNSGTAGTGLNLTGLPFAYAGTSNAPTLVAFTANNLSNNDAIVSRMSNSATSLVIYKINGGTVVTNQLGFASGTVIYEV